MPFVPVRWSDSTLFFPLSSYIQIRESWWLHGNHVKAVYSLYHLAKETSTLSMLSDFCFHKQHFPQYHELKKKWLVLITAQDLVCDYAECSENLITDTVRLNCFHTFHKTCLDKTGNKCPICVPCLSKKISSLCEAFNESIIKPTHPGSEQDYEINDNIQINANIDPAYYESSQWETHIETELNSFTVRQP